MQFTEGPLYVERVRRFKAMQADGSEANTRELLKFAYSTKNYVFDSDDYPKRIRWSSAGHGNSYFEASILVKIGNEPTSEEWTLPGDWVVRHEDGRLEILGQSAFEDRFEKMES